MNPWPERFNDARRECLEHQPAQTGVIRRVLEQHPGRHIAGEELEAAHQRAAGRLPNLAIPELNSVGAQEIFVTTAQGLCDFISAMDTARIPEWNCWYHVMNCGFPLKVSGETDFPCITGSRVGQGRVYVQAGKSILSILPSWT